MTKFSCEQGNADLNSTEVGCQSQHSHLTATTPRQVTPRFQSSGNGVKVSARTEDSTVLWTSHRGRRAEYKVTDLMVLCTPRWPPAL